MRTCVGCGRRTTTDQLVRVTRGADGRLVVGRALPGRGAWLCAGSSGCVERAGRRGAFTRALRAPVGPESVRALLEQDPFPGAVDGAGEGPPP